jgi:Patched family
MWSTFIHFNRLTLDERRVLLAQARAILAQEQQEQAAPKRKQAAKGIKQVCKSMTDCIIRRSEEDGDEGNNHSCGDDGGANRGSNKVFIEKFMAWYARTLMKPVVRNSVIICGLALMGLCIYSTFQLRQKFDPQDYVPDDSYIQGFFKKCESIVIHSMFI